MGEGTAGLTIGIVKRGGADIFNDASAVRQPFASEHNCGLRG